MKKEILPLTGVRGVAATMVMLYHMHHNPRFAEYDLFFLSKAYLSVDLFFILSGFVMALVYAKSFRDGTTPTDYKAFMINRLARVFPLHLVVTLFFMARMIFNISGKSAALAPFDVTANIFMVQAWGIGAYAFAGNSWSVSAEIMAYLLFPALVYFVYRRFLWAALLLGSILGIFAVAYSPYGVVGQMDVVTRYNALPLLRCLSGFTIGLVAYRFANWWIVPKILGRSKSLGWILALIAALFFLPDQDALVALSFPFLVISLYHNNRLANKLFGNRIVHHLGVISYSMYLWHPLFRDICARAAIMLEKKGYALSDWWFIAAAVLTTWIASWLSYIIVEVHGRKFVRHFQNRFSKSPVGAS